jgi:phosphoglycolate phosphatase
MNSQLTVPKGFIFDWDNTLADTWPIIHAALNDTLHFMGHELWSLEKVKRDVHRSMRDSFPELFGEGWQHAGAYYMERYRHHRLTQLQPLPYAINLLEWLKKNGFFTAVVSNKMGPSLREEIAFLKWEHFFSVAIGASDAKEDKPSPLPALLALEGSGLKPGLDIWFIGDSVTDLRCATRLGASSIFFGENDSLPKEDVDYVIHQHCPNHAVLLELIQSRHAAA